MIPRIRELLHTLPFQPFTIRTRAGREYVVQTPDHAAVSPSGGRVVVFGDDDSQVDITGLPGLHVAAVLRNGQVEK
jgi:hypothetical protein